MMFKYVWLCMLLGGYIAWGIFSVADAIRSRKLNMQCEELTTAFIYTTVAALFIASFITWIFQFV